MKKRMIGLGLAMMAAAGCQQQDAAWETIKNDARQIPGHMWTDSQELVQDETNLFILLAGGGASGYVRCAHDDEVEEHFIDHETFPRDFTIGQGVIGNPISHFALAASGYIYGLSSKDEQTREVSLSLIEGLSLNGILTMGLKGIALDESPNGENLAWPSGHTSSTVTFATIMNEYYGPWVGLPLYALSGFVMYERMETGEHWASDVVFGAALGYTVGRTVAQRSEAEIFGMRLTPYISPLSGASGMALTKQF